ncbi:hypothetical protein APHAL10511_006435 [Amanita phalloides]|nr:hypothetical protein APHAL10511_006435 [Amanita phalloides]
MQKFVITMSDATGFGTGGVSRLLTVGTSKGGCNTKSPSVPFTYQLNTALRQCRPFMVSGYSQGVQPVTLYGVIPRGTAFVVGQSMGQPLFNWTVNVAAGTRIIFFMVDAQGHQGGSSDISRVGNSNDASCLDQNSPSLTASVPTYTIPTGTSIRPKRPRFRRGGISLGAIAGTVIGSLLFLAVIITLGLFFLRRQQQSFSPQGGSKDYGDQMALTPGSRSHVDTTIRGSTHIHQNVCQSNGNPFEPSPSGSCQSSVNTYPTYPGLNISPYPPTQPSIPRSPTSVSAPPEVSATLGNEPQASAYDRRGAKARGNLQPPPSRFIVHTDLDDEVFQPDKNDTVELPPRYTERHTFVNEPSELGYL